MTRGHPFSNDLRQVLITMGTLCSFQEVLDKTGVPRSTLRALYAEYRKNGHIHHSKLAIETRGRKRKLTTANSEVRLIHSIMFVPV